MNQDEEIIFSFKKIKRIWMKYWYIVLIALCLGVVYVGFSAYKTVSAAKAAVDEIEEEMGTTTAETSSERLAPTGTTYFNLLRYIKVDWSEKYPELEVSDANTAEENYYILKQKESFVTAQKDTLSDCDNIDDFQSFKDDINSALTKNNYKKLSSTDYITIKAYGNDVVSINVYAQCSAPRLRCIVTAAMNSYISTGQELFGLGKCSELMTNEIMAYSRGTDGKYTALYKTASEWLSSELTKGSASTVAVADTSTSSTAVNVSWSSALMSKKNIIVVLGALVVGLGILFLISVFDHVMDVPDEVSYTSLDKLGEVTFTGDNDASARVFMERATAIAAANEYHKLALVSLKADSRLDDMCSANEYAGMISLQYPDTYQKGLADIQQCDAAIIAIHGGVDKKTALRQCIENVSIDSKVLGYVWVD